MTRTGASVTTVLAIAALDGSLAALYSNAQPTLSLLVTFGPQVATLAVLFWWLETDSVEHGLQRSMLLNVGMVALTVIFLPVYLYRSRPQGKRLKAILKSLGLFLLYLFVGGIGMLVVVGTLRTFPPSPTIEVRWVGIYSVDSTNRIDDAGSLTGKKSASSGAHLEEATTIIPAILDTSFGVGFDLHSENTPEPVVLRVLWLFPEGGITNSSTGKTASSYESKYSCRVGARCGYGFRFTEPWEMVPGTWTLQLWLKSTLMLEQEFEVRLVRPTA